MAKLFRGSAAAATLCLFLLMIGPFQGAEQSVGLTDKPAHALAFAIITAAILLNFAQVTRLQAVGLAILAGVAVEGVQGLSGRDMEFADVLADALGAILVALVWRRRRLRWRADEAQHL